MQRFIKALVTGGFLGVFAFCAVATPIELAPSPIGTQPADQGQTAVSTWLGNVVTAYNAIPGPGAPLPAPGAMVFRLINDNVGNPSYPNYPAFGTGLLDITIPMGQFNYLVLHWGGNPSTDPTQAWYIGGEPIGTTQTFHAPARQGLSGYSLFGPRTVPDGGTTLMLLGMGLTALVPLRRFLNI